MSFLSFRVIFHFHDYGRKGTLPKTNIAPKNDGWEDDFPLTKGETFSGAMFVFRRVVEGFLLYSTRNLGKWWKIWRVFVDGLKSQTTSLHSFGWKSGDWCFCVDCGHSDESLCDFKGWKWKTTHWYIIGKLLVPLGWYPSCLNPPRSPSFKRGIYRIYPRHTYYIRCIYGIDY